jgi:hypothetical protein
VRAAGIPPAGASPNGTPRAFGGEMGISRPSTGFLNAAASQEIYRFTCHISPMGRSVDVQDILM